MRLRPLFPRLEPARHGRSLPGMSLVELMVVAALMVVVTGAGFTLFQIAARHEAHQQDVLNQTENLRTALNVMARNVRMAGNGLNFLMSEGRVNIYVDENFADEETQEDSSGWFRYKGAEKYGARAIYGTHGECSVNCKPGTDTLTIFRAEIENPLPLGFLKDPFTPGVSGAGDELKLVEPVTEGETIARGDIVAVSGGGRAVILQTLLGEGASDDTLPLGSRFKPEEPLAGLEFPAGSAVFNLRNFAFVTYYIDPQSNRLMANYHGGTRTLTSGDEWAAGGEWRAEDEGVDDPHLVAVAGNIEDLKVEYFLTAVGREAGPPLRNGQIDELEPDLNEGLFDDDGKNVRMVSVTLTSRSSRVQSQSESDRRQGSSPFTRQNLTEHIYLRNF